MTHSIQHNNTIPVDAIVHLRSQSNNQLQPCHVLAVSDHAVHVLLDAPLNNQATVSIMVRPEGNGQQPYFVSGEVKKRGLQDGGWLHEVVASSNRPWSPMFQYDVICSTSETSDHEHILNTNNKLEQNWADLTAWEQAQPPLSNQIAA